MTGEISCFLATFRQTVRIFLAEPTWLLANLMLPVALGILVFEIYSGSPRDITIFTLVGIGGLSIWGGCLWGAGIATIQDRFDGTLEILVSSPSPYYSVIAGRIAFYNLTGLAGLAVLFVLGVALLGRLPPLPDPEVFIAVYGLVLFSFTSTGLLFASLFIFSRLGLFVGNATNFGLFLVTGCAVPISALPGWVAPIAYTLPPTWALDALRYAAVAGYVGLPWGYEGDILGCLCSSAVCLVLSGVLLKKALRHAHRQGTFSIL